MKHRLCLLLLAGIAYATFAQNPAITSMYTADPSARVFNDTLYLYPSHDHDSAQWWDMTDWHVFSTTDMKHWTDHGIAFSLKDTRWAKKYAWAPDCGYSDGRYYFYYPTDQDYIGVAVGSSPVGPFTDPLGVPLITRTTPGVIASRDLIDPCIFTDDDGQSYLFFGQNTICVVALHKDMISFKDSASVIQGAEHFFEAVWVHKYNGKYYLSYSGDGKILYAMSDKVLGPYEFKGEILDTVNSGTNHHSIVQYKGRWYLFYHTSDLALQRIQAFSADRKYIQWRRSVCIDYLYYNADGTIQQVKQSREGVAVIRDVVKAQ